MGESSMTPKPPPGFQLVGQTQGGNIPPPPDGFEMETAWSDVPGLALQNAPQSAVNLGKAIAQPFLHPIETAKSLGRLAGGVGSKIVGAADTASEAVGGPSLQEPYQKEAAEAPLSAVGGFFKDRYGSVAGLKKTAATDPLGLVADAATVLTGGGAAVARLPGAVGRAGQVAAKAGSLVDPVSAAGRAVASGARGTGKVAASLLGQTTGAQSLPIEKAFEAGRKGSTEFTKNMRGYGSMDDVASRADSAVGQLVKQRGNQYKAWNPLGNQQAQVTVIDLKPLESAVADGMDLAVRGGVVKDKKTAAIMTEVEEAVNTYKANGWTSPKDLDELKQIVWDIGGDAKQGSRAKMATMKVYNAIGDELKKQVPGYADTMKNYGKASELIKEMRRELSLNDKATAGAKLRKLQSAMRGSANTGWGKRTQLVDELAKVDREIPFALAGQSLNSLSPRGIQSGIMGGALGAGGAWAALSNPTLLAGLPFTMPRVMGEAAYGAGKVARGVDQVARKSPMSAEQLARALMISRLMGETTEKE